MITEDYVSFEVAKLLKEKGFNIDCFAAYNGNGKLYKFDDDIDDNTPCWSEAPTLQMAMKWLLEKYNMYIEITINGFQNKKYTYHVVIQNLNEWYDTSECYDFHIVGDFDSPEKGYNSAIKYCLEKLI